MKRGGFAIGRKEINQAEEYVDDIYKGNKLNCHPIIRAFVVGDSVSPAISVRKTQEDYGEVYAYTYSQLVRTAEKRLFNLKEKLTARYEQMGYKDQLSEILGEDIQDTVDLPH